MYDMEISYHDLCWEKEDIVKALDEIKAGGFTSIHISEHNLTLYADRAVILKEILEVNSMSISSAEVSVDFFSFDSEENIRIANILQFLHEINADSLVVFQGKTENEDVNPTQKKLIENLEKVVEMAAEKDIRVSFGIRSKSLFNSKETIKQFFSLASKHIFIAYDSYVFDKLNMGQLNYLKSIVSRIGHVYLTDKKTIKKKNTPIKYQNVPLGKGGGNIEKIISSLESADYKGWVTVKQPAVRNKAAVDVVTANRKYLDTELGLLV